ncbi:MAG: DUF349 domain-containing protein [Pseudarcicella sp.]|nr:DUF349 domain-containing protein [Pseudarcicella sp.]MBP6411709.1 DUF349 domain-containing protein [Pseudarcicella sp.]
MENTVLLAKKYGHCKNGKVYLNAYSEYPEREIGIVKDSEDEALAYFGRRFEMATNKVILLFDQIEEAQNKGSYLTKLLQLRKDLLTYNGLGDFMPLIKRLNEAEFDLRDLILTNQIKNLDIKRALIEEVKTVVAGDDWMAMTESLMEIKVKWLKTGPVDKSIQDDVENEYNRLNDEFFVKRREYFTEKNRIIDERILRLQAIVEEAFALRKLEDIDGSFAKIKELQREWKGIGAVPPKKQSQLWKQFKKANDWFFERYNKAKGIDVKPKIDPKIQEMMLMTLELEKAFPDQPNIPATSEKAKAHLVRWKELAGQTKNLDRTLAERFRNICDKIFEMNYLLRVVSYRHPELDAKPRMEQLKIMINQMDYMAKKEKAELDMFITDAEYNGTITEKMVTSKINTQKRKIAMKEILLTQFKTELDKFLTDDE